MASKDIFQHRVLGKALEVLVAPIPKEKSKSSVPDATITQESFKLVVETKTSDWFHADQLIKHLEAFGDEKCKVLITLAPAPMGETKKAEFNSQLKKHNESLKYPIIHINIDKSYT